MIAIHLYEKIQEILLGTPAITIETIVAIIIVETIIFLNAREMDD
jgi:hypothetical protein